MVLDAVLSNLPLWLVLFGTALVIAEAFSPGAHFFVGGLGLLLAGIVGLAIEGYFDEVTVLAVMTVTIIVSTAATLYLYRQFDIYGGADEGQTSDSDDLRGKTGRVTERVSETDGEVKLDHGGFNPFFRARTTDGEIPEGEEVMVIDPGGGNVITVETLSDLTDDTDEKLANKASQPDVNLEDTE